MTITTDITPIISYQGNGSVTAFAVPFVFYTYADLVVVLTDSGGTDTTKTYTTHYTVSGGGTDTPDTGTVTMLTAPASGETLTIYRAIERSQDVDYILYNTFPADLHEKALDKLTLITQDLAEEVGRAAKVGVTSGLSSLVFPDPEASKIIAWNSAGTDLENVDMSDAVLNINALTAETSVDGTADYIPIYDTSAGANRKVLTNNLPVSITTLTEDTSPDAANDFVITYDASDGTNKKVKIQNIPQTGGNAPVGASYLTLATNATLTSERVLTASTGIALTDNGAGNSLDVAVNVNGPAEKTSPVATDFVLGYDVAGTATKKFKITNLPIGSVNNLTEDTSPSNSDDYILTYDTSAGANRKVLIDNLQITTDYVKLSTTTVSAAVGSISFTNLSSAYNTYILEIIGVTGSASASLYLRTSTDNGATYTSSASAYYYSSVAAGTSTSGTEIRMVGSWFGTSGTGSGRIILHGLLNSSAYSHLVFMGSGNTNGIAYMHTGIRRAAETNNAFQIYPSTGNFTAGTFILYGVK